jgi:hypothetical protein
MIDLVRRAQDGSGSMVLVSGEAGVGKTRLAEETSHQAKELGLLVLHGHCMEMDITLPFQPLIEQIEQAVRIVDRERMREALGENAPEAHAGAETAFPRHRGSTDAAARARAAVFAERRRGVHRTRGESPTDDARIRGSALG